MSNKDDRERAFRAFANYSYGSSAPVRKINCFTALMNWKDWNGRASRKEYWLFFLFAIIVSTIATILDGGEPGGIFGMATLILLLPSLAVAVRRLHDTGKSGWWLLLVLLSGLGHVILFVFFLLDSQPGPNRYGENPKEIN